MYEPIMVQIQTNGDFNDFPYIQEFGYHMISFLFKSNSMICLIISSQQQLLLPDVHRFHSHSAYTPIYKVYYWIMYIITERNVL